MSSWWSCDSTQNSWYPLGWRVFVGGKSFQVLCFKTRTGVLFFSRLSPLFGSCINFFLSNIWQPFSIDCRRSTRTCTPAATRRAPRPSTSEQAGRTPGTARCSEGRGACIFSFPCPMTQGIGSCQPQAGPSYLYLSLFESKIDVSRVARANHHTST